MKTEMTQNHIPTETLEMLEKLNSANKNAVVMTIQGIYMAQKNMENLFNEKNKKNV